MAGSTDLYGPELAFSVGRAVIKGYKSLRCDRQSEWTILSTHIALRTLEDAHLDLEAPADSAKQSKAARIVSALQLAQASSVSLLLFLCLCL